MPTAEAAYSEYLFRSINKRLMDKGFQQDCTNGWGLADMDPKTLRPYMIILPIREVTKGYTAKRKFVEVEFALHVVTNKFEEGQSILKKGFAIIQNAPLTFPDVAGLSLTLLRPGDVEYEKDVDEWLTTALYTAELNQQISHSPS